MCVMMSVGMFSSRITFAIVKVLPLPVTPSRVLYLLPLFMLLVNQDRLMTTKMDYYDEMGLFAFSSGMNLIIIVFIWLLNLSVNKLTNSGIDKGLGGK